LTQDGYLEKWNQRHHQAESEGKVAQVLLRNMHLLPVTGVALDLACGRGASALLLVEKGLETHAWDFSPVAIEKLQTRAEERDLSVHYQVRDVVKHPPERASFDVILVSFFLDRSLFSRLIEALKPGGKLYYQTFVQEVYLDRGPTSADWRLRKNELLQVFKELDIHYYREDGSASSAQTELSDLAMLVASKRS